MFLTYFGSDGKLFVCLELCSAGTDDVETACISELVDIFVCKNDIVVFNQSAGTALETIELIFFVGCL